MFTLKQFQDYISQFSPYHKFKFTLSDPFSWRGSYDEVAFSVNEGESTAVDILLKIQHAYREEYIGYKGGKYSYNDSTLVNFEENRTAWSDEQYAKEFIETHSEDKLYSLQEKLVRLAFK